MSRPPVILAPHLYIITRKYVFRMILTDKVTSPNILALFALYWNQQSEYRVLYKLLGWLHWIVCRKCIQWYTVLLKLNHTSDWVWLLIHEVSRRTTVGRTPLDVWSARRRDLYLTTHNTHNRQTSMPRWDSNPRPQQARGRRPTP